VAFRVPLQRYQPDRGTRIRLAAYDHGRTYGACLRRYGGQVSAKPASVPFRRLRRLWTVLDWTAAALCAVIVFGVLTHTERAGYGIGLRVAAWPLVLLLALGLAFPVTIRRKAPLRALAIVLAGCVVLLALGASLTTGPFLPLCLVLYVVATTCRRNLAVAALVGALALLAAQGALSHYAGIGPGDSVGGALFLVVVWTVGYAVQQRRTYLAQLRDRAASDAVTRERLRIARELHDVVAHSMTVVTVQAGFGEYVFDSQPAEARAALGAIQAVSREALGELQRLLCVLRQPDTDTTPVDQAASGMAGPTVAPAGTEEEEPARGPRLRAEAPLAPAPGLASLDRLVQRTAGAGVTVSVDRTGSVRVLPAGIDLSAFRIVQEALTNVVKHSGAECCQVRLDYGPADLLIEVTDHGAPAPAAVGMATVGTAAVSTATTNGAAVMNGPAAGRVPAGTGFAGTGQRAGHGIIGMRERVSLCGGEFSAAPRPGGGFVVRARLPLDSRS
jgi:signal transduction histidine kinase